MNKARLGVAIAVVVIIAAFFIFDLGRFFDLAALKSEQARIAAYYVAHPFATGALFFAIYVAVAGLSLPGAALMTLVGGAVFGLAWGTVLVSFASTIGATLAFLASRFVLRDMVQRRFGEHLKSVDAGIERDGAFYLFALRLVPAFPFFIINLVSGLTSLRVRTFYWVSQVGMLAGTIVYVNAGTRLAHVDSLSGILSPGLIASFTLLGVFPLFAKWIVRMINARKLRSRWPRPRRFDRNLIVIGAGSAGLVAAYIAAAVRASVTLIEKDRMGGDCLNTGCVPSKALIRSARFLADVERARGLGMLSASADFDFAAVMERVQRVVQTVAPHDSVERYTALGVECITGEARMTSPWTVAVNGRTLSTRSIVIAAGSRPLVPPLPGIDDVGYLTTDTIWNLRRLPPRLLVLGGGPVGCELAQSFARFGSQVTIVERLPRLLAHEDSEVSRRVLTQFEAEGIRVLIDCSAREFHIGEGQKELVCTIDGNDVEIDFDDVLIATGRIANTTGYGLEELGIPLSDARTIDTNAWLQALYPNIYACGDVAGPFQFTHTAAHQAWYAAVNALFGSIRKFKADYSVIPSAVFTDPEIARVGLNEREATEKGIAFEVTTYDVGDLDRAIADEAAHGIVRVLTVPGRDRILGVTIVGEHASEMIAEFVLAMRHRIGLNKLLGTIHVYPTFSEANKLAAGAWKRAHAPQRLLGWLERYHAWMRG
ncbi:MAG TPA: FAD-dependent oxidoreductase [Burkholderiales bacterium]|nr:FAD-dependent oxidoreductase [Burkholderiales bacterium]